MADAFIQVAPDSSGAKMDTSRVTVGANDVDRERINLSDPTAANSHAAVKAGGTQPTAAGDGALAITDRDRSATGTLANITSTAASQTLQAANASRLGWTIYNDSTKALYVACAATASSTSFTVKIASDGYWELPFKYTGIITGIWASANGAARVTEFT